MQFSHLLFVVPPPLWFSPSEQPLVASPVVQGRISYRPGWEFVQH